MAKYHKHLHNDVCVSLRHNTLSPQLPRHAPQGGGSQRGGSSDPKSPYFHYYSWRSVKSRKKKKQIKLVNYGDAQENTPHSRIEVDNYS